jgi:hypothetical protein
MSKKKRLKALRNFCKKHWRKWTILIILAMVVYAGFIFYQYIYKPIYQPREIIPKKLEIRKDIYQDVMDSYFERQGEAEKAINKIYPDPFK